MESVDRSRILNINVGVLGHVDSGKTSLVKALSTSLSTAALDKNPQSQQRGITLDLGFSSFTLPLPDKLRDGRYDYLQFTLVDCPGHASLIRTIIGGAQIIDMMLLVVDANKGIQTQTAECIVIGEITTDKLIIVMNKIDMIPAEEREVKIARATGRIRKIFATTKFYDAPIVLTSAAVGGEKVAAVIPGSERNNSSTSVVPATQSVGIDNLLRVIGDYVTIPTRAVTGPLYFAVDHCFAIKGHGTVLTGTVLSGSVNVNDMIEIPNMQVQRKVKSMQMFRKPARTAIQGDRVGMCVTHLDPNTIERGIVVSPGSVAPLSTVVCLVKKVRFFKTPCRSNTKFHVSVGHSTVVATVTFFGAAEIAEGARAGGSFGLPGVNADDANGDVASSTTGDSSICSDDMSDHSNDMMDDFTSLMELSEMASSSPRETTSLNRSWLDFRDCASGNSGPPRNQGSPTANNTSSAPAVKKATARIQATNAHSSLSASYLSAFPEDNFPWGADFQYQDELVGREGITYGHEPVQWAVIQFQQPAYCPLGSLVIGSRLDSGSNETVGQGSSHQCRLSFYGPVRQAVPDNDMSKLNLFHWKMKEGEVFRLSDIRNGLCVELIGWKMFAETSSVNAFIGMKVETERGNMGTIVGSFGAEGKFRVKFEPGVKVSAGSALKMRFKRYVYDKMKSMDQTGLEEVINPDFDDSKIVMELEGDKKKKAPKPSKVDAGASNATLAVSAPSIGDQSSAIKSAAVSSVKSGAVGSPAAPPVQVPVSAIVAPVATEVAKATLGASRAGVIESCKPETGDELVGCPVVAIIKDAFRMEDNIKLFVGHAVIGPNGEAGSVVGPFGKMGKCKVRFEAGLAKISGTGVGSSVLFA